MGKIEYSYTPMPTYARSLLSPNAYILLSYLIDEWDKAGCCPFEAASSFFGYAIGVTDKTLTKAVRELEYYRLIDRKSVGKGRGKINATWKVLTDNFNYWKDVPYSTMLKIRDELSSEKLRTKITVFNDDDLKRKKILPKKAEYFRTKKDTKKDTILNSKKDTKLNNNLNLKEEMNKEEKWDYEKYFIIEDDYITSKDMLVASLEEEEMLEFANAWEEGLLNPNKGGNSYPNTKQQTKESGNNTKPKTTSNPVKAEPSVNTIQQFLGTAAETLSYLYHQETRLGDEPYHQCKNIVRDVLRQQGIQPLDINHFISNSNDKPAPFNLNWQEKIKELTAFNLPPAEAV